MICRIVLYIEKITILLETKNVICVYTGLSVAGKRRSGYAALSHNP